MKYKNEINYNSHSLNIIHTMTKDSIRTKCTTAYVARNHLYLSAAWLQRYQQTSQKNERCLS